MSLRGIAKIVNSRLKVEGTRAKVHRSLGIYQQRKFNPFYYLIIFQALEIQGSQPIPTKVMKPSHMFCKEQLPMKILLELREYYTKETYSL